MVNKFSFVAEEWRFMICGLPPKALNTCGPLLINRFLQYHGRAIYSSKGLCPWPSENRSVVPKRGRGPLLRNPGAEAQT